VNITLNDLMDVAFVVPELGFMLMSFWFLPGKK